MKDIDENDFKILRTLLRDASVNYETISREVGISVSTIHNRIKRMREEGVIIRTIPEVDARRLGFEICAMIDVRMKGGHLEELQEKFSEYGNVCSIYDVTGEYDATFVVKFRNTDELNRFVKELAGQKHVLRTSTKLVLNVIKEGFLPEI